MKIALITIHEANNYGAILQTYATQETLSSFGSVETIDYENRHIAQSLNLIRFNLSAHGVLGTGKDILRIIPRSKAIRKFREFSGAHIKKTKKITKKELSEGILGKYDTYVAGSDQIWNPSCISKENKIDETYFLNFAPKESIKISYASSIGSHTFSKNEEPKIKELLNEFHAISVRESGAKQHLENLLGKEVHHVLDPTLLIERQAWEKLIQPPKKEENKSKYILFYTVPKAKLTKKAANYYKEKLGIKVVSIDQGLYSGSVVDRQIRDAGPIEFLDAIKNAEFIVTDSFHGVCFSLIFSRPFIAIAPGKHSNRIESLLTLLGIENRLARREEDFESIAPYFDMAPATQKLSTARAKSIKFIKSSLETNLSSKKEY